MTYERLGLTIINEIDKTVIDNGAEKLSMPLSKPNAYGIINDIGLYQSLAKYPLLSSKEEMALFTFLTTDSDDSNIYKMFKQDD